MENKIIIKGARVHNLKNVSLEIPKNQLVVFTGVSGSGKSSLAFDTIFAEGQRRYIESLSPYARQFLGQMERADVDEITGLSPAIAINQKALSHNPRSTVGTLTEIYDYLRVLYARMGEVFCPNDGTKIEKLTLDEMVDIIINRAKDEKVDMVTILSPVVQGRKGEYYQLLYDFLNQGFSEARVDGKRTSLHNKINLPRYKEHNIDIVMDKVMISDESRMYEAVESAINYSQGLVTVILNEKTENEKADSARGSDGPKAADAESYGGPKEFLLSSLWTCPQDGFAFPEIEPRLFSFNSPHGACPTCGGLGKTDLFLKTICPDCEGKRLRKEALSVRIMGKNLYEITAMTLEEVAKFFAEYEKSLNTRQKTIAQKVVKEIRDRVDFLLQVGLDYITMSREAETLSGGEAQRIRLASQIGSHLSGALYVLDEPTIGLHERDTARLIETLKSLKAQGNSVVIVEHDDLTILEADYLVDLGPYAGRHGGEVVAEGEISKLLSTTAVKKNPDLKFDKSLTLKYLREEDKIEVPEVRRTKVTEEIKVIGANKNNLKNVNVDLPLRKLVAISGVSGSGKSTLLYDVLYENLNLIKARMGEKLDGVAKILGAEYVDRVVVVDQSPIGRTPRSNPATYTGVFTPIRDLFASLPEAKEKGYTLSKFSFNVKGVRGGRCEACEGAGFNLIEMHFLPPVLVQCEICHGKRFNREILQVKYNPSASSGHNSTKGKHSGQGKNISEVLDMTIDEAYDFFENIYQITDKLKVLKEVGLGYLQLGQSATTLSGGEAQRIKLAKELTTPLGKRGLYLLDEPTVGLHYHDIELLLKVLNKLVEKGNSIFVIEHNMHIIKSADYLIDLGPEGGERGGKIVAEGTPEEVAKNSQSMTGKYLKSYLQ